MSPPLVSVIIPCYRQAHFLPSAVESVLKQSYPAIEPIVVNDGSDDDTEAVASRYRSRVRYVYQQNGGLPSARNAGIRAAGGKYLLFLDSDDLLHPDAVAALVRAADDREDRLCMMGVRLFKEDPHAERCPEKLPPLKGELLPGFLGQNWGPPHCHLCPRRMVVACGGFEESLRSCEDWDLWIRLLFHGADICPVPLVGAYYRQSPGSMSRNKVRMCQTRTQVLLRTLIQLRQAPPVPARWGTAPTQIERTIIRPRIREELLHAAFLLREQGNYTASLAHYLASIWHGQLNRCAVLGIGKLLPHWLIKRWGRPGR